MGGRRLVISSDTRGMNDFTYLSAEYALVFPTTTMAAHANGRRIWTVDGRVCRRIFGGNEEEIR
jgi:hypothetical protein